MIIEIIAVCVGIIFVAMYAIRVFLSWKFDKLFKERMLLEILNLKNITNEYQWISTDLRKEIVTLRAKSELRNMYEKGKVHYSFDKQDNTKNNESRVK